MTWANLTREQYRYYASLINYLDEKMSAYTLHKAKLNSQLVIMLVKLEII